MPADINAYALGLELQLQTKPAFDSLAKFEQKLQYVEKKVAEVGSSPLATTAIENQTAAVGLNALARRDLDKSVYGLMQTELALKKLNEEAAGGAEHLTMTLDELQKKRKLLTEKYHAEKLALKEISKAHKEFNEEEKDMLKLGTDIIDQMDDEVDSYKQVEEQLANYSKAIKVLSPLLKSVGISEAEATEFAYAYSKGLALAFVAVTLLTKGFAEVMAMQEAYAKTTFSALGTQLQLIELTNELRSTLGATTDEAIKTLTSLSAAGFRASDRISELAEANYMFVKSTGVSESVTADYQRRLTVMGVTAEEATQSLAKMSAMIRNSGLSAQAAGNIINGLNKTLMRLNFAFGKKQAKETGEMIAKLGAAAHAAGAEAEPLAQSLGTLATDSVELQKVMGATGIAFDENASQADNLRKLMKGAAGGFRDLGIPAQYVTKVLRDMGFEDVALGSDLINKKAKELGTTFDPFVDSMSKGADLTEDFNNALATFRDSLRRILAPLMTLGAQLLDVVGPALIMLLKPIVAVATAVGSMITALMKIPGVGLLIKGAVLALLVPSILKGITAFTGLGKLLPSVTGGLGNVATMFKAASPNIKSLTGDLLKQVTAGKLFTKETGNIISRLGNIAKMTLVTGNAAKTATGAVSGLAGAAEGAGGGLMSMGGGALQAAMGLAKAHPLIAAVVAAVGAAFLVVPKLFEMFNSGSAATSALAVGLAALLWPLTSLYVTMRVVWAVMKGVWEAVSKLAEEAFKPLMEIFKSFKGPGEESISFMDIFNKAMDKLTKATKVFMLAFKPVVWLFKMLGTLTGWVVDGIKKAIDKFAPVIKFAEWAINKISKFLGMDEEAEEQAEKMPEDLRSAYEKMWGTHEQVSEALKRQHELLQDTANEAKMLSPEVIQTVKAAYAPPPRQAEPVVSPAITDKTGRAKTEEHNEKMLTTSMFMSEVLNKMLTAFVKSDSKADVNELVELLKTWLPKIAEEKSGGLATAANQWL